MTAFKIGKEEQTEQDFLEVCSSFPEYWSFEEMNYRFSAPFHVRERIVLEECSAVKGSHCLCAGSSESMGIRLIRVG